jgi:hypothetical protein
LESVLFKLLDIPDEEEEEDELIEGMGNNNDDRESRMSGMDGESMGGDSERS